MMTETSLRITGWAAGLAVLATAAAIAIRYFDLAGSAAEDALIWQVLFSVSLPCILGLLILAVAHPLSRESSPTLRWPLLY